MTEFLALLVVLNAGAVLRTILLIEGGAGLLTLMLAFGTLVVIITFLGMLWVTYKEWKTGSLW